MIQIIKNFFNKVHASKCYGATDVSNRVTGKINFERDFAFKCLENDIKEMYKSRAKFWIIELEPQFKDELLNEIHNRGFHIQEIKGSENSINIYID